MLSYSIDPRVTSGKMAYWNRALREVYGPCWSLSSEKPADFRMAMSAVQVGGLLLFRATTSRARISNTAKSSRPKGERTYNICTANRMQRVVLEGKPLVLNAGDFILVDSKRPAVISTDESCTTLGLTVPANFLHAFVPFPEDAVGVRFSGSEGISQAVPLLLNDMWSLAEAGTLAEVGNKLVVSLFEVFSACCVLARPRGAPVASGAEARRAQVRQVIQNHLRDPDLTVISVAKELGLSPRYIQMLFKDSDESIAQYIRRQRLEGCRKQLADLAWHDHSITDIAFRGGFNSVAHFCRAFKAQYRVSPSRYRRESRLQPLPF